MSAVVRTLSVTLFLALGAEAQVHTLVVQAGPVRGLDGLAATVLQDELERLLAPAGIDVIWKFAADGDEQNPPEWLVTGSLVGTCSVEELASPQRDSLEKMALGEAPVSAGRILPLFRIDCNRVIRLLYPALDLLSPPLRRVIFGRALARVAAHEIYHILTQTAGHEDSGLAKASFVLEDLTSTHFGFNAASLERLRQRETGMAPYARLSPGPLQPE